MGDGARQARGTHRSARPPVATARVDPVSQRAERRHDVVRFRADSVVGGSERESDPAVSVDDEIGRCAASKVRRVNQSCPDDRESYGGGRDAAVLTV